MSTRLVLTYVMTAWAALFSAAYASAPEVTAIASVSAEVDSALSAGWDVCPSPGDCYAPHPGPGCEIEACCNLVCVIDFECSIVWDSICVEHANDLCGCAGEGGCFEPNGTPSCSDEACCAPVCEVDPFCCETEWDCKCADAALVLCGNEVCPGEGGCLEVHETPGCSNEICCNTVCSHDPECCEPFGFGWDPNCVDLAATLCAQQGDGDCMVANGTPGCDNADCATLVCAISPWCCENEWDHTCAAEALELCGHANCGTPGDCYTPHAGPGCEDEVCCNSVCLQDSDCCDWGWDSFCADRALELCTPCPGNGSCDLPNATPGCENDICCADICDVDPYCCGVVWDTICAEETQELCQDDACPGEDSCYEYPHGPGCDDAECCNIVCLADWECCFFEWDELCYDKAVELCGLRNYNPANATPILSREVVVGSTDTALPDSEVSLCGVPNPAPGVWYQLLGTGGEMTIDTCNTATDYDSRIAVFTGDCPRGLTCVAHDDNSCGLQASVTWMSEAGEKYLVLVHGTGAQTGNFELTVWCAGDFDADRDVDLSDAAALQRCFNEGDGASSDPTCICGNLVGNAEVNSDDFRIFVNGMTGP